MARRFFSPGTIAAVSSAFKTPQVQTSAATVRPKIWSFTLSTLGAAADGVLEWIIQRFTAAGTNASVEPTYTANSSLFDQGLNQRATYTWTAWTEGAQLVAPATAANGLGIACLSSVAPAFTGVAASQINHEE